MARTNWSELAHTESIRIRRICFIIWMRSEYGVDLDLDATVSGRDLARRRIETPQNRRGVACDARERFSA
jgi:hypothetical protein